MFAALCCRGMFAIDTAAPLASPEVVFGNGDGVIARESQLALPAVKKLEAELAAPRKRLERAGENLAATLKASQCAVNLGA